MSVPSYEPGSNKWRAAVCSSMFYMTSQPDSKLRQLRGPFAGDTDFNSGREQSSSDYAIVTVTDLSKEKGDMISVDIVGEAMGEPKKNDEKVEGTGESLPWSGMDVKLGYTRKAINGGTVMQQQRSKHRIAEIARKAVVKYGKKYEEELIALHAYGDRGYHTAGRILPTDPVRLAKLADNPVLPTTRNRAFVVSGSGLEKITASGGEIAIASTDKMSWTVIENLNAVNKDGTPVPVQGCKFEGDTMGAELPISLFFADSLQYKDLRQSTGFRKFQANALARAGKPGQNLIFTGGIGLMDNCLVAENRNLPCRFYSGNTVRYSANLTDETVATGLVPAAFASSNTAISMGLYIGQQALVHVMGGFDLSEYGENDKRSAGYKWSEKLLDHGDTLEIVLKMLESYAKVRFNLNWGTADNPIMQPTDYGIMTVLSAVSLQQ